MFVCVHFYLITSRAPAGPPGVLPGELHGEPRVEQDELGPRGASTYDAI